MTKPRTDDFEVRDFLGCLHAEQGETAPGLVYYMENMYARHGLLLQRPGAWRILESDLSNDTDISQAIGSVWLADGTLIYFEIKGGEIYSGTLIGGSWSKVVSTANLTTAGVTLSSTVRVYWCQYRGTLVVNDGTNQPFTWDGTSGAAGVTLLTSAPSECWGKPTVYYGKLFFIVGDSGNPTYTIVWSEENQANVGYTTSPYNNAWDLTQTGSEPIGAILGTNGGLFYFRSHGIGVITGAVTSNFQTTGVDESVSDLDGCLNPDTVVRVADKIFFVDRNQPKCIWQGYVVPLWEQMREVYTNSTRWYVDRDKPGGEYLGGGNGWGSAKTVNGNHACVYDSTTHNILMFCTVSSAGFDPFGRQVSVFNVDSMVFQGFWGFPADLTLSAVGSADIVGSSVSKQTMLMGFKAAAGIQYLNHAYAFNVDKRELGAERTSIRMRVIGPRQAWSMGRISEADRLNVVAHGPRSQSRTVKVNAMARNPYHYEDGFDPTELTLTDTWDDSASDSYTVERHYHFNLPPSRGRWFQVDLIPDLVTKATDEVYAQENTPRCAIVGWSVGIPADREITGGDR